MRFFDLLAERRTPRELIARYSLRAPLLAPFPALATHPPTRYSLLSTRYSALVTQHSLLSTRYSALVTQHSLLSTRYSAFVTQYWLLRTRYSLATLVR